MPNKADGPNPAIASLFHAGRPWRGVGDLRPFGIMRRLWIIAGLLTVACGALCFLAPRPPHPSLQFVCVTNRWTTRTGEWCVFRLTGDMNRFSIGGFFMDRSSPTGWVAAPIEKHAETVYDGGKDIFIPRSDAPEMPWRLRLTIQERASGLGGIADRIRDLWDHLHKRNVQRFGGPPMDLVAEARSK